MAYRFEKFSAAPTGFRVGLRRHARLAGAALALGLITLGGIAPVGSCTDYEPIDITVEQPYIVPGQTLPVQVELTGAGSAHVTIYSTPSGAVSYQGTVQSGDTILATTSNTLAPSTAVTLYAVTDGLVVVQTQTSVQKKDNKPFEDPN